MTPATDAAREALERAFRYIDNDAGAMNGVPNEAKQEDADSLAGDIAERLGVPFDADWPQHAALALTEAASQPREGENRFAVDRLQKMADHGRIDAAYGDFGHPALTMIADVRKVLPVLTQRPPEQAGAVPAGIAVTIESGTANSYFFDDRLVVDGDCIAFTDEPWTSRIATALSAAPTPPDAGPGEIPAGMVLMPSAATREMVDAADACTDAYEAYGKMVEVGRVY